MEHLLVFLLDLVYLLSINQAVLFGGSKKSHDWIMYFCRDHINDSTPPLKMCLTKEVLYHGLWQLHSHQPVLDLLYRKFQRSAPSLLLECKKGKWVRTLLVASRGPHLLLTRDWATFLNYNVAVRGSPVLCTTSLLLSQLKLVPIYTPGSKGASALLSSRTQHAGWHGVWTHD